MSKKKLLKLQMFADGVPSAEGNGGETNVGNATDNLSKNTEGENLNTKSKGAEVDIGEESFENLISGRYKADFENAVNSRLTEKENSITQLSDMLARQSAVFDALGAKYGKKSDDIDGILKAVSADNSYFEEAAAREGVTVEQFRNLREFDRMQQRQRSLEAEELARSQAEKDMRDWFKQGEKLKETYPDFDFQTEIKDRNFLGLLKNGISVEHAYKTMHADEMISRAAENAEKNAVAKLQQKSSRPLENGTNSGTGALINTTQKLTRKERAEMALRAQRGEKITF